MTNVADLRTEVNAAITALDTVATQLDSVTASVALYDAEGGALSTVSFKDAIRRQRAAVTAAKYNAANASTYLQTIESGAGSQILSPSGIPTSTVFGGSLVLNNSNVATGTVVGRFISASTSYTDGLGNVWASLNSYATGQNLTTWAVGTAGASDATIYNSEMSALSYPSGSFTVVLPIPVGSTALVVRCLWAEHYGPAAATNKRRNTVYQTSTSGTKLIDTLDVYTCCTTAYGQGQDRALVLERNVTVAASASTLTLVFATETGSTWQTGALCGIEIRTGSDAASDPAALNAGSGTSTTLPGTRSKFYWPFTQGSIWNTPIGSSAVYQAGAGIAPTSGALIYPDWVYVRTVASADPFTNLYTPSQWVPEASGGTYAGTFQMNAGFTLPDHTASSQPNNHSIWIQPDGETVKMLVGTVRPTVGGNLYAYRYGTSTDSYTTTLTTGDGAHGAHASQLNAMGGALRPDDFTGPAIYHVLDLELNEYYWYKNGGSLANSYVWPAINADSYWNSAYGTSNPSLPSYCKIGMLLAIHPSKVYADYSVTTTLGKKFFDCFQNYGAYATESVGNASWNVANLAIRDDASPAANSAGFFNSTTLAEIARMIAGLYVITNNGPTAIGGGGTPRVPLAPPFA